MPSVINVKYLQRKDQQNIMYVGRLNISNNLRLEGSCLANPFPIQGIITREKSLKLYREYLELMIDSNNIEIIKALRSIREDTILGCWCKPFPCHADIIIEICRERGFINQLEKQC